MISEMKGVKISEEIIRIRQILRAADINLHLEGNPNITNTPLLVENVLTMRLKEAVRNIVKNSQASSCHISITQSPTEVMFKEHHDGIRCPEKIDTLQENRL